MVMAVRLVAIAGLILIWGSVTTPLSARQYGALATGPDGAYGWINDADSPREADYRALRDCGRGCSLQVEFHDTCAAYATGSDGAYGWERYPDPEVARGRAVEHCREHGGNCRVRVWACAR
jgi:hypothetical protein